MFRYFLICCFVRGWLLRLSPDILRMAGAFLHEQKSIFTEHSVLHRKAFYILSFLYGGCDIGFQLRSKVLLVRGCFTQISNPVCSMHRLSIPRRGRHWGIVIDLSASLKKLNIVLNA